MPATKVRNSPWRSEVYAPSDHVPRPDIIYFGCRAWEPKRDLSMGRQDEITGLWSPGRQRVTHGCKVCGRDLKPGEYCDGCFSLTPKAEEKLTSQYIRDVVMVEEEARKKAEEQAAISFAERHHGPHERDGAA